MERPVFPHFTSNRMFYSQNRSDFLSRVRSSYFGFCYLLLSFKALVSDDTVTHTHDVFEIYQSNAIHVQVWQFYKTLTKIVIINVCLYSFLIQNGNRKCPQWMSSNWYVAWLGTQAGMYLILTKCRYFSVILFICLHTPTQ